MFEKNYINSVTLGLKKSIFKVDQIQYNIQSFFEILNDIFLHIQKKKGRIFFFGNGASASFSNHMSLDWSKNGDILALSLSDSSLLTALANDFSYEEIFTEFVKINSINSDDFVVLTSSSGNSKNIINVIKHCSDNKIKTLGLSGLSSNNFTNRNTNFSIFVPCNTYGMVECIHQIFHHLILDKFMEIKEWEKTSPQNMNSQNFRL